MKEAAKKEAEATGFLYLYNICGCFFFVYIHLIKIYNAY